MWYIIIWQYKIGQFLKTEGMTEVVFSSGFANLNYYDFPCLGLQRNIRNQLPFNFENIFEEHHANFLRVFESER